MDYLKLNYLRIIALSCVSALAASAATTTYSDRNLWLADVTTVFTADFANATTTVVLNTSSGTSAAGMQFVGYSGQYYGLALINPTPSQWYYQWGSGAFLRGDPYLAGYENRIRVNLPTGGATAVGLDVMASGASAVQVRVNGTTTYNVPTFDLPTRAFFGITSDVPIQFLDVLAPAVQDATPMIDNISRANMLVAEAPIPEPEAMGVAGLGVLLVMLGWKRRREQRLVSRLQT